MWLMSTVRISASNLVVNFVAILVRQSYEAAFPRCKMCQANLQLVVRARHVKGARIFIHVLKSHDNRRCRKC